MSALLIDLPLVELPAPSQPRRWMHVVPDAVPTGLADPGQATPLREATVGASPALEPAAQLRARPVSHIRPVAATSAAGAAPLRLTRRGLADVVGGFSLLMMTAFVVLVVSFFAVSNDPIAATLTLN